MNRLWLYDAIGMTLIAVVVTLDAEAGRPNVAPIAVVAGVAAYIFAALAAISWARSRR